MYYIYAYIDPRTDLPFYIGKGKNSRKFDHLKDTGPNPENKAKSAIIQELKELGLIPVIIELEKNIADEDHAYLLEDFYIRTHGRRGLDPEGILTNICLGNHPPKPIWTPEKRAARRIWNNAFWTAERRIAHGLTTKGNKGGAITAGTVNVTDRFGHSKRIPKSTYDIMSRPKSMSDWEYVSVTSSESKRRKEQNTP